MMMRAPTLTMTAEEFLAWPENSGHELINGQVVEMPEQGAKAQFITGEIHYLLAIWARSGKHGWAFPNDSGILCFTDDPNRIRKPDVCFVRAGRFEGNVVPKGWINVVPDLAVEVISPNDVWGDVSDKITDYLEAGVKLVWVVDPIRKEVHVYRLNGKPEIATADDELKEEAVLPGFVCKVADFFVNPTE